MYGSGEPQSSIHWHVQGGDKFVKVTDSAAAATCLKLEPPGTSMSLHFFSQSHWQTGQAGFIASSKNKMVLSESDVYFSYFGAAATAPRPSAAAVQVSFK
jgi:hypothetical protein